MVDFTRQLMYGQSPVHRSNPTSGQSEWYYIDPRYGDDDPRRQIDVPSEYTPNPRAGKIQNHLYNNDKYNYKQLYGNAEPPSLRQNKQRDNEYKKTSSGKYMFDDIVSYIPTYRIGEDIATVQNTYNKLRDLYSAYKRDGAMEAARQYAEPSVRQATRAYDWLTPLPISDVNKHQYVSCVGANGGVLASAETLAGGLYKEFQDYNKKVDNPRLLNQYGGRWGVFEDNVKDFKNDLKGAWKGYWADNVEECETLLPENYRNKKY